MVVIGVQSTTAATAAGDQDSAGAGTLRLSAAQRADAIKSAQADASSAAEAIGLGGKEKLVVRDVVKDTDGTVHTRYERTYDGLPVLGGDLVAHTAKSGKLKSVDKARGGRISVASTDADVSSADAKKSAVAAADSKKASAKNVRKVIWAGDKGSSPVLAYETVVTGVQHDGTPSELHVVTDARTGKQLFSHEAIENGTGTGQYSGSVAVGSTASASGGYDLTDGARGGHKTYDLNGGTSGTGTLFHDADDKWGDGTPQNRQTAAVDAAYGAAQTWDFYKSEFNRNGIAGDGKAAYSRVHYGNAYVNAFWSDACFCMTYGDGAGNLKPLTSLDVAGHEMSHGLTASTAKLNYSRESGGLNEATSDILGTSVEFYSNNPSDVGDYLIGEKIDIRGNGTPLRYMDKPSKDGNSADFWSKNVGRLDVHYSSGVANHFFYLLSEGSGAKTINGVSYDSATADGSSLTGIGRTKAYQIWYKALSVYMTSTTNYAGARTATLKAAADLYGAGSAEEKAVAAAWTGVNVK
ncbi:M4 family metallopeptidase [Streptomyces sp. NBC_01381]|uniref:M4 family metallopeptidase n=1 Tax=Streptomyces sp. NBC_01381 TaxID=2903845 RepID=UPI00225476D5|nr:M4 family metallopeptidase [Streptomyces sp. NBC_01381]MCX4666160.1 M4 family metallopeptidase [Streptomyces sp. NBC_01381]